MGPEEVLEPEWRIGQVRLGEWWLKNDWGRSYKTGTSETLTITREWKI